MKLTNPVVYILLVAFTIVNIVDIVTGLFILPAESNPLFLVFNNFIYLIIFKIIFVGSSWWIYYKNKYPSKFTYYMFLLTLTLGTLLIALACVSNIIGIMNPVLVEESSALSTGEKAQGYGIFVTLIYILPMLMSLLTFKLYEKSEKYLTLMKRKKK